MEHVSEYTNFVQEGRIQWGFRAFCDDDLLEILTRNSKSACK